jgi:hypothetical protein
MSGSAADAIRRPRDRFKRAPAGAFSNCGRGVNPISASQCRGGAVAVGMLPMSATQSALRKDDCIAPGGLAAAASDAMVWRAFVSTTKRTLKPASNLSNVTRPPREVRFASDCVAKRGERVKDRFDLQPRRLAGDTVYGAVRLLKWLVDRNITPHIPVWDKSARSDGSFSRADFVFDRSRNVYICPCSSRQGTRRAKY